MFTINSALSRGKRRLPRRPPFQSPPRLQLRLREEEGYTYGASASFEFRRSPGTFAVRSAVRTDATAAAVADVRPQISERTADHRSAARARLYFCSIARLPR